MRYAAKLLVVSDARENRIEPCLNAAGYYCTRLSFKEIFTQDLGDQTFDLVLIDGDNNTADIEIKKIALAAEVHTFSFLIIGPADFQSRMQTISSGYCSLELLSRVSALVRLETMHQELLRRIQTTEIYGLDLAEITPPEPDIGTANILIVGSKTMVLGNILLRLDTKTNIRICKNPSNALEDMRETNFDAVILSGVGQGDSNLRLCNDIRADTRFYNLPLLMVLENTENREAAYIHGASDVIMHEHEMDALTNRIGLQIREYRYRFAMQKLFQAARSHPVADGATDLYSAGFMRTHIPVMIEDHHKQQKVMSLVRLCVENLDRINEDHGYPSGDQILRQIGTIISNLVRSEDFCAHYKTGEFLVALPGTGEKDAGIALNRIVSVLKNTEFAIADKTASMRAEVIHSFVELQRGANFDEMIDREFQIDISDGKAA